MMVSPSTSYTFLVPSSEFINANEVNSFPTLLSCLLYDISTSVRRPYILGANFDGVSRVHQWPSQSEGVLLDLVPMRH